MKLSKKDCPKLYGPNGLYAKFSYIKKVIASCTTVEQVAAAEKWGIRVLTCDNVADENNLNPPINRGYFSYLLDFNRYYMSCCKEIRNCAFKKVIEIKNGKEEGKAA